MARRPSRVTTVLVASAAAVMLGGALLSACSSSSSSSTTAPATGKSTTTVKPTSTTAVATSTTAGSSRCATTALSGSVVGSSGAAGTVETTVALKSTAPTPCVLDGYPGMQLLSSSGASLPTNVVRKGSYSFTAMSPTTVILAPGQSAYFNIGYSDVPVGSETTCPTSASVQVTPPNAYDQLVVTAAMSPCGGGTMVVSPVFAATPTNTQTTAPASG
jgi:hypothetical protein